MSRTKRYLEDLYYNKVQDHTDEELIEEGMDPEDIKYLRDIFEIEEED